MGFINTIIGKISDLFVWITEMLDKVQILPDGAGLAYTAVARWIFIALAIFILVRAIVSLLSSKNPSEVWGYFNVDGEVSTPITHWENAIGRARSSDIRINDPSVSRTHGSLTRDDKGRWKYKDLGSSNGTIINGKRMKAGDSAYVEPGDQLAIGASICTMYPISLEERRNNMAMRKKETLLLSPWTSLIAITLFQMMTVVQLSVALKDSYSQQITMSFIALAGLMWVYFLTMRAAGQKGFEMELIAFFISTLSLAVTSSKYPNGVLKQTAAVFLGVFLFIFMCAFLRNLERSKAIRKVLIVLSVLALVGNLLLGTTKFGATNWVTIGGLSIQPSEIVKLAFIWVGAASLDELLEKRNTIIFTIFAGFCFVCLALMGDFGTALIFFVSFLVISFLRSGDITKLILVVGVAFVGGLLVLRFKAYIAERFSAWGHVWEYADGLGYQQTRTMASSASGGLVGLGAGGGWLKNVAASETDLVFGFVAEEWGLIMALLAVASILTLSVFAVRSIWSGRSTFYTIAACSAMSLFIFQTTLNVFGALDMFPLTGVTFPFLSSGGTSMISSWGMLAFLKAADTRMSASLAVSNRNKGIQTQEEIDLELIKAEEAREEREIKAERERIYREEKLARIGRLKMEEMEDREEGKHYSRRDRKNRERDINSKGEEVWYFDIKDIPVDEEVDD